MNKLIIADDEGKTTVVPLVRDEITIGRKEGNTIRLTERNVSRRHARLLRSNGVFILEDLKSYNGVKVNGDAIATPRPIKDGDRITIGDYQLSLRSDKAAVGPKVGDQARREPPNYARLVMLGPPEPGREFPLEDGELIVGRTDENALVINHPSISRSHAKIIISEGSYRLLDLDSANGIRVNNQDFTDTMMDPGDLIEFGTVRLRFVGPGEDYEFDADATVQMSSVTEAVLQGLEKEKKFPLPLVIVCVIVVLIAAIVSAIIMMGNGETTSPSQNDQTDPSQQTSAIGPNKASVEQIVEESRGLFEKEQYSAAKTILDTVGPTDNPDVPLLRAKINQEQEAQHTWKTACDQTDQNDEQAVYDICKSIRSESRYREKGCCEKAAARYGRAQVKVAKGLNKQREYAKARDIAQGIIDDRLIPESIRDRAQREFDRAEKQLAGSSSQSDPSTSRDRDKNRDRDRNRDRGKKQGQESDRPPRDKENASTGDAFSRARAAVLRGDQQGCIRELRQAPRSAKNVRLLITCYQQSGNISSACQLAKRYERYSQAKQFYQARCR